MHIFASSPYAGEQKFLIKRAATNDAKTVCFTSGVVLVQQATQTGDDRLRLVIDAGIAFWS
jgi:hypothetical protein